ncbi:hypothetical protein A3K80_03200 [Candidatus Bathyarchaeota archaeon RBG_13_38_9]|nr:MAG: hypothetical protein A3K80_03200 [Candidatus Bathyarchaeota archaeon RBG_13_38_9]
MGEDKGLRFRIRRGDYEVELEGEYQYVKETFEKLLEEIPTTPIQQTTTQDTQLTQFQQTTNPPPTLQGKIEYTPEGKPRLTIPVDMLKAKEALALILYAVKPTPVECDELSHLLSSSWKTMKPEAVRARASELRREGRLIAENGKYSLSGAGNQWVEDEILRKLP